jgi:hypothetical protein
MSCHKFKLGRSVVLQPTTLNRGAAAGAYEVTKQLLRETASSSIRSKAQASARTGR